MSKNKAPTCAPRTAVAYARYSSAGQRDVSIDQQLENIRAFAAREGYMIVHEYADHARSGFKNTSARTAFQEMLKAAENGAFDTVIAWKVDRFGRNREESAIFKGRLRRFGVSVVYAMEPIPEGAAGVLLEGMLEATAEWYSRNLSENVIRGLYDNARRGLYNGAYILGYSVSPQQKYQIDPVSAPIVRRIFSLYSTGYSYADICRKLASDGILNSKSQPYSISRIQKIISNEAYIGIYHWGNVRIPDGMPALIDRTTWEAAQRMRKKTTRTHSFTSADFLLTGKAVCACCGANMTGDSGTAKSGTVYYYYTCLNKKRGKPCSLRRYRKELLEDGIINYIMDEILTGPSMEKIADAVIEQQLKASATSPLAKMEQELKAIRKKIANINDAIEAGIWDASTAERLRNLSEAEKNLHESVEALRFSESQLVTRDRVLFFLDRFASGDRNSFMHRKFIVSTFVNVIYVYSDHVDLVINAIEGAERLPLNALRTQHATQQVRTAYTLAENDNTYSNLGIFVYSIAL